MNKTQVLVSGAVLFRENKGSKIKWFLVKPDDDGGWEIPKVLVRKGESSVRASLRMLAERGNMTTKVLEEVGRAGGTTTVNGKVLPQRHIYYLAILKSPPSEAIGFEDSIWLDYAKAVRKISSKRERAILKQARKVYSDWKKARESKKKK